MLFADCFSNVKNLIAARYSDLEISNNRFGERLRDGQYSLVSFLLAVLLHIRCSRAQPFVKVGARAPLPYGVGPTAAINKISWFD